MTKEIPQSNTIAALTGVRIIPALLVVCLHFGMQVPLLGAGPFRSLLEGGSSSVSFFFFLSGFILTHVYADKIPLPTFRIRNFLAARLARIYPVYLLALLLQVAFAGTVMYVDRISILHSILDLQAHVLLLQAWMPGSALHWNAPGWSLSVEAFLYLSFPFFLSRARLWSLGSCVAWAAGIYLFAFGFMEPFRVWAWGSFFSSDAKVHEFLVYYPLFHWPGFALGSLTCLLVRRHDGSPVRPVVLSVGLAMAVIAMIGVIGFAQGKEPWSYLIHNGLLAPFYGLAVAMIYLGEPLSRKLLGNPAAVLLGEASYSVYVLQIPVHGWLGMMLGWSGRNPTFEFVLYLVALLVFSTSVFLVYERPARAWLRRRLSYAS